MSSANSRIIRVQERTTYSDKSGPRNNANMQAYDAVLFFEKLPCCFIEYGILNNFYFPNLMFHHSNTFLKLNLESKCHHNEKLKI